MLIVEVELPIKGSKEEIDKMLLKNGFEEFYKVLTISTYYKLKEDKDLTHGTLKSRCKRIRYVEPLVKFKNDYQDYKEWIKKYEYEECADEENALLNNGYEKIYTDEKTDYVYKSKTEKDMYFQIQDIKGDCLIIAYDNKNYYEFEEITQKKRLIQDILKYGIEILDDKNIDRFKLIGKTLTIKEIIDKMNDTILKLK